MRKLLSLILFFFPFLLYSQMDSLSIVRYYTQYNVSLLTDQVLVHEASLKVALVSYNIADKQYNLHIYVKGKLLKVESYSSDLRLLDFDRKGNLFYTLGNELYQLNTRNHLILLDKYSFCSGTNQYILYTPFSIKKVLRLYSKTTGRTEDINYSYFRNMGNVLFIKNRDSVGVLEGDIWYWQEIKGMSDDLEVGYLYGELQLYDRSHHQYYRINYRIGKWYCRYSDYLEERTKMNRSDALKYSLYAMSDDRMIFSIRRSKDRYNVDGYRKYTRLSNENLGDLINAHQNLYEHVELYNLRDSSVVVLIDSLSNKRADYSLLRNDYGMYYWIEVKEATDRSVLALSVMSVWLWNTKYEKGILLDSLLNGVEEYYASPDGEYIYMISRRSDSLYRYRMRDGLLSSVDVNVKNFRNWSKYQYSAYRSEIQVSYYWLGEGCILLQGRHDLLQLDSNLSVKILNADLPKREGLIYRLYEVKDKDRLVMLSYDYNSSVSGMYLLERDEVEVIYLNDGYHYINYGISSHEIRLHRNVTRNKKFVYGKEYVLYFESYNHLGESYVLQSRGKKSKEQYRLVDRSNDRPFPVMQTCHISVPHEEGMINASVYYPVDFDTSKKYPVIMQTYLRNTVYRNMVVHPIWNYATNEFTYRNITYDGYIMVDVDIPLVDGDFYRHSGLLNSVNRYIRKWEYVDSTAIGLTGHSMGGAIGIGALIRDSVFSAAILFAGVNFYQHFYLSKIPKLEGGDVELRPMGYIYQKSRNDSIMQEVLVIERTLDKDPFYQLDRLKTPVLIVHNREDEVSSFDATTWFFVRARLLGKDVQLVEFKGQGHILFPQYYSVSQRLFRNYFRQYLKKE